VTLTTQDSSFYCTPDAVITRDRELEAETVAARREANPDGFHGFSAGFQPIMQFKDSDVLGYGEHVNEYREHGRDVPDFNLREPSMAVDHVADLCICQHSRLQHAAAVTHDVCAGKRNGERCRCERFNPVSPKGSRHAYKRGQKVTKRRLADLVPGDRVLAGWTTEHGKVRLTDVKTGALIVEVVARTRDARSDKQASGQTWFERAKIVSTDLGETVPQAGGTYVLTVGR
jgi:hypothetical protein